MEAAPPDQRGEFLFKKRVFERILTILPPFAAFMTPLLFFVDGRDQFELPKLTFLAVTGVAMFALSFALRGLPRLTPLTAALLALFLVQVISSLPGISLSWRTSLLGDYENFAGLASSAVYLLWFLALSSTLTDRVLERTLFLSALSALLSSLHALGQHAGFDFVQWNPESVIGNREFASLGNPNFLAAYLAMALPLAIVVGGRHAFTGRPAAVVPGRVLFPALLLVGLAFLLSGTSKGAAWLGMDAAEPPTAMAIGFGWTFLCIALVRYGNLGGWLPLSLTATVLSLGLLRTGSRGGFLAAGAGLLTLGALILRDGDLRGRARGWIARVPPSWRYGIPIAATALALSLNRAFLDRLTGSVLRAGDSFATSRLHIWKPALAMFLQNPLIGTGLDTFKIAFPRYAGPDFNRIDGIFVSSRTAHNEWLQAAATTGLPGLLAQLALLLLFVLALRGAWKASGVRGRWVLAGVAACGAALQVQNLFSFGVATVNLLWVLCLAAVTRARSPGPEGSRIPPLARIAMGVVLALTVSVASMVRLYADVAFGHGSAALDYVRAFDGLAASEKNLYTDYALKLNRRAAELLPLEVKYRLYLALAYERKADLDPSRARTWLDGALGNYDRALEMSPSNAYYHNNRERVLLARWNASRMDDDLAAAERSGRRAVELAPESPFFKVQWVLALLRLGREGEARKTLREAFDSSPDFAAKALAQLATDEYLRGDGVFALRLLDEAVAGNTSSAEAYQFRGLVKQQMGRTEDALKDLIRARQLKGPDPASR
jgi:tetratricopeptide (TPR) repeat protein